MGPVSVVSLLSLPVIAVLLISFHDESGAVDTRNRLSGLRTRETLASREAWDAAHAWMRRPMRILAAVLAVAAGLSVAADLVLDLPEAAVLPICLPQTALLIGGLLFVCRRADRVAAQVNERIRG